MKVCIQYLIYTSARINEAGARPLMQYDERTIDKEWGLDTFISESQAKGVYLDDAKTQWIPPHRIMGIRIVP